MYAMRRLGIWRDLILAPPRAALEDITYGPIIVSGFFQDLRGISQAARLTVTALRGAGCKVMEHDVSHLLDPDLPHRPFPGSPTAGVWIIHCNPPEALALMNRHRELSEAPIYRIGVWAWELSRAPIAWRTAMSRFHEIWAPSRFSAEAFGQGKSLVRVMPHPVPLQPLAMKDAGDGLVRFTTFADLRSTAARKNPLSAISAYLNAFPEPGQARLLVKLMNSEVDVQATKAIFDRVGDRSDVEFVLEKLTDKEMEHLYVQTDVLLSLHRSEGFGLPIAEAMAAGKAVVATGWSGNLDFMTGEAERQLVSYSLVPVRDPTRTYVGGLWAEPDIVAAAQLIRDLAESSDLRQTLGRCNRHAIETSNNSWSRAFLSENTFFELTVSPDSPDVILATTIS